MGENIYQLHFRRGADIQGLQRTAGIKHQGNKAANQHTGKEPEEVLFKKKKKSIKRPVTARCGGAHF